VKAAAVDAQMNPIPVQSAVQKVPKRGSKTKKKPGGRSEVVPGKFFPGQRGDGQKRSERY